MKKRLPSSSAITVKLASSTPTLLPRPPITTAMKA